MYGIVANVISDRALRTGAKVWVLYCNGDAEHPKVTGLSKSGRTITKYTAYKRLTCFRAAWIPEGMLERVAWQWGQKEDAAVRADSLSRIWDDVRFFNRDGSQLVRDGITGNAALRRNTNPPSPMKD